MSGRSDHTGQLGFDALLQDAEQDNRDRLFERRTAHLPGTMEEALPFYRAMLERHHAAMMAADTKETMRLREEAHDLAVKLNGGDGGILAHADAPGYVLGRETAAPEGAEPLWGQQGAFIVAVGCMRIWIEMDGLFGICSSHCYWPGFSAHAVDWDRPFLSPTGYRSYLGIYAEPQAGVSPASFAQGICARHIAKELRGKALAIEPRYRERRQAS